MENKNTIILKIIGDGKINKGVEKLVREYDCADPKIKKIIQQLYGKK